MANNPWLNKTWHLMTVDGPAAPLLQPGKSDGTNRFKLIAYKTSKGAAYYKAKFKSKAMTKHWNDCVFVPRGNVPVALQDRRGKAIAPPGPNATVKAIGRISRRLVRAIDAKASIGTLRLECDLTLPDVALNPAGTALVARGNRKRFGKLRLFQVPHALGNEDLLITDFAFDLGNPGGSGGGGSVHDHN